VKKLHPQSHAPAHSHQTTTRHACAGALKTFGITEAKGYTRATYVKLYLRGDRATLIIKRLHGVEVSCDAEDRVESVRLRASLCCLRRRRCLRGLAQSVRSRVRAARVDQRVADELSNDARLRNEVSERLPRRHREQHTFCAEPWLKDLRSLGSNDVSLRLSRLSAKMISGVEHLPKSGLAATDAAAIAALPVGVTDGLPTGLPWSSIGWTAANWVVTPKTALNASAWSPVFAGLAAAAACAVWHSVCAAVLAPHELMSVSQMNWEMMPDCTGLNMCPQTADKDTDVLRRAVVE
jgi:hypothetical protein